MSAALFRSLIVLFLRGGEALGLFAADSAFPHVISTVIVSHKRQYSPCLRRFPILILCSFGSLQPQSGRLNPTQVSDSRDCKPRRVKLSTNYGRQRRRPSRSVTQVRPPRSRAADQANPTIPCFPCVDTV